MGTEIEKITSFSRTQISPIFIKDILQIDEPTYNIVEGIGGAPFVVPLPYFYGSLTGDEVTIQATGEYTKEFKGVIHYTPLVTAKVDISLTDSKGNELVNLKNFFGRITVGLPKGETGTLKISNPNPVDIRVYLINYIL